MQSNIDNFIGIFDDVVDQDFCNYAMQIFESVNDANVYLDRQSAEGVSKLEKEDLSLIFEQFVNSKHFNSIYYPVLDFIWKDCFPKYVEKYSVLETARISKIFNMKIQKTSPSQGYHIWHYETCDSKNCEKVINFMIYLNDVEEGGETEFLYQSRRINPVQGRVVLFPTNYTHAHRGNPPLNGDKYVITGWLELE